MPVNAPSIKRKLNETNDRLGPVIDQLIKEGREKVRKYLLSAGMSEVEAHKISEKSKQERYDAEETEEKQ